MSQKRILFTSLGKQRFEDVWVLQKNIHSQVLNGSIHGRLITVEHFPVFTFGKMSDPSNIQISEDELAAQGISCIHVDRGGDITFHGEGQLVAYPIFNMTHFYRDAHRYLRDLEAVIIKTLYAFDIHGNRKSAVNSKQNYTGVWVGEEKICAIGVKFSRWTTMHGLALNVNTDLEYFKYIVPCGIHGKSVTSMKKIKGEDIPLKKVETTLLESFEDVFGATVETCPLK